MGTGTSRQFDLVENQDGPQYTTFESVGINGTATWVA